MKNYELTIVLPGEATKAQKEAKIEFLTKLLNLYKGKITKTEDWGVKTLAFKIQKHQTGLFVYFEIELDPASIKDLNEKLRLEDGIIRYLIVKADK